uniref:Uncharacterized protein n=1 Tax=Arundo donax TaxID=35708 RepID=A0A0A9EBJ2_ARUDO
METQISKRYKLSKSPEQRINGATEHTNQCSI